MKICFNKDEFKKVVLIGNLLSEDITNQRFILQKADEFIDFLNEASNNKDLKTLTNGEIAMIKKDYKRNISHIGGIMALNRVFAKIISNYKKNSGFYRLTRDIKIGEYSIFMHFAFTYSALCEFIRFWLSKIVSNKSSEIDEIGELINLIKKLEKNNNTSKNFFKLDNPDRAKFGFDYYIDNWLRNAFFHLNFKIHGKNLYYTRYDEKTQKNIETNFNCILLQKLISDVTSIGYVTICGCSYYITRNQQIL